MGALGIDGKADDCSQAEAASVLVNRWGKLISANLLSKAKAMLASAFGGGCCLAPTLA